MPTVLITGGHSGIGLECVRRLAAQGFDIVLAGRSPERMDMAAASLRADFGVRVHIVMLDTSSLASVRQAVAQCREMMDRSEIDILQAILCNAGATFRGAATYSDDGYERMFATNFLGHFLFVQLMLDRLAEDGRVVFTASGTHDPDTADGKFVGLVVEPDALVLASTGRDGSKAIPAGSRYTTSKLCTILHAYELDRRLRSAGSNIASIAFDPGAISETSLLRDLPKAARMIVGSRVMKSLMRRMGITVGDLKLSGISLADLAVSPAYASVSGRYFQWKNGSLNDTRSSKMSYDQPRAEKLWKDAVQLAGLTAEEEPNRLK